MALRDLPSVDALVRETETDLPAPLVVELVRTALAEARQTLQSGGTADPRAQVTASLESISRGRYQRVVNATGVILHTNLGRAPLHPSALDAARRAGESYGNLELDLDTGRRGGRGRYLGKLLTVLTGAESAHVVNNNAGALLLTLAALAYGRRVPVSRGELIEIGGSYRLPELMSASGAVLAEVGTTNRTRISDYELEVETAALILKVHPSNYRVVGFSEEASAADLALLAERAGIPLVYDVGSGLLDADVPWVPGPPPQWLAGEPGVRQELAAGADLVTFSGDKLLGGPQAGIIVGRTGLVDAIRSHPIARALRVDGPTQEALTATLEAYLTGQGREIPFWRMATLEAAALTARLEAIRASSGGSIVEGASLLGAGSVPGLEIPTPVLTLSGRSEELWSRLLSAGPPIFARRDAGSVLIDVRTVDESDDLHIARTLGEAPTWR